MYDRPPGLSGEFGGSRLEAGAHFMRQSTVVPKREMKVRVPANSGLARFFLGPVGRFLAIAAALVTIATAGVFTYFYDHYSHVVAEKLHIPFANTAKIYGAPESVAV